MAGESFNGTSSVFQVLLLNANFAVSKGEFLCAYINDCTIISALQFEDF